MPIENDCRMEWWIVMKMYVQLLEPTPQTTFVTLVIALIVFKSITNFPRGYPGIYAESTAGDA